MNERITDEEAVARVKTGDSTFYDVLAARHSQHLQRLAQRYLRNDADAEDAVQDAHLLAFTRIHQYAERSSFLKWISAITVNQALMRLRKSRASLVAVEGDFDLFASPVRNPEQQAISRNVGDIVDDALAHLPDTYRSVFVLRDIQSLNTAETSDRLGLTHACVKTRLARARRLLRGALTRKEANGRPARVSRFQAN